MRVAAVLRRPMFERLLAIRLHPGHVVALGGILLVLLGATVLMLPFATMPGVTLTPLDAIFTATSAVCASGLIVLDTPQDFTMFGQIVILLLIQIGALGYATMASLLLLALGQRVGLKERMLMAEAMSAIDKVGLVRFIKMILLITIGVEVVGTALLTIRFGFDMEWDQAFYFGLFHAVAAFNNAGFSLFSGNLTPYRADLFLTLVITILVLLGGLGFLVFRDVIDNVRGERFRFQSHTKLAVTVTALLVIGGSAGVWMLEFNNPQTFLPLSTKEQVLTSYFQAVSARTGGFSTIDLNRMRDATLYFIILLMAIGGSPGGTAGGIKTTTFGIVVVAMVAILRRRADVEMFHRRVPADLVVRAVCVAVLAMALVTFNTLVLAYTEDQPFLSLMFEVTSAIGTVGLSVGDGGVRSLSALFSDAGKVVIIITMLLGRFGPLIIGLFAAKTHSQMRYRYPESRVVIG
jgi:trk system potassium uptake protein TrkH